MGYKVIALDFFQREAKRLIKKYPSLKNELERLGSELEENPTLGTPIVNNCFKIRVAISSKGKGKSGGARVITHVFLFDETVFLLSIYDKSERGSISSARIKELLKEIKK